MRTLLLNLTLVLFAVNATNAQIDTSEVFPSIEALPEPEGGWETFYQFLGEEVKYPKADLEAGIEGKVIVQFVVQADGSVTDVKPYPGSEKEATPAMIEEAIRVISLSPKWKPGKADGEYVRVLYQVPISFFLTGQTSKKRRWWQKK